MEAVPLARANRGGTNRHTCPVFRFTLDFGKVKTMRMCTTARRPSFLAIVALSAAVVALCGCPATNRSKPAESAGKKQSKVEFPTEQPIGRPKAEEQAEHHPPTTNKTATSARQVAQDVEDAVKKPHDLGPPLVDDPGDLKQLYPKTPVWIDKKHKWVVLQGEVCSVGYPLEFFVSYPTKAYESVVAVNVNKPVAWIVHTGLVAVGAEPGHPAQSDQSVTPPKFSPPTGTEIAIEVRWKDKRGKVQSADARQWVRNIKTKKALDTNWVFAGSVFVNEPGERKEVLRGRCGGLGLRAQFALCHARSADVRLRGHRSPNLRSLQRAHLRRKARRLPCC